MTSWSHDKGTAGDQFAYYLCDTCGERYPFLVPYAFDVLVGGVNCNPMAQHGPGCKSQRWNRVSDVVVWPQPQEVLEPLKYQTSRYVRELAAAPSKKAL